jgi:hypothetical protein
MHADRPAEAIDHGCGAFLERRADMSLDPKRWAQKAQELKFTQLDSARRQAEGWRTGLGGLTTLLSAALIIKGATIPPS